MDDVGKRGEFEFTIEGKDMLRDGVKKQEKGGAFSCKIEGEYDKVEGEYLLRVKVRQLGLF